MVIENITEYMNSRVIKKFSKYEVGAISRAIGEEFIERKKNGPKLRSKTKEGKKIINERIIEIIKKEYGYEIKTEDVVLYKKCRADEYSDRTGKCAWGFADVRKKRGYDPNTGLEIN